MVLRSINLPASLDEELRSLAFFLRRPKSDLVRYFIVRGLTTLRDHLGQNPSDAMLQKVARELDEDGSASQHQANVERDLQRARQSTSRRG
jgi:hypothetical protein